MMTTQNKIDTGGSAFPTLGDAFTEVATGVFRPKSEYGMEGDPGMSLRDWLAGLAMQQLIHRREMTVEPTYSRQELAAEAYAYADAMLAARKAGGT
jgi:hypothetical protein